MSSFTGSQNNVGGTDVGLQVAPTEGDGPDLNLLRRAFEQTVTDCQPFVDQCRLNYETRYALWNGQSADGKKHSREGSKIDPTPWDGASDLRVYELDSLINYKVDRNCMALMDATFTAAPVNGSDIERARVVSDFLKWLVNTQIPELEREAELLNNYLYEKGVACTGQFWETTQEKTLVTLKLEDFQKMVPTADLGQLLQQPEIVDSFSAMIENQFGVSGRKAKQMIKELTDTGETTAPVDGKKKNRPIVRAFNLDRDLFVPSWATDLEHAPYIFRIEYYTAEQLRSFVNTDGWDEKWVEKAIATCRGQFISPTPDGTQQPISRSFVYIDRKILVTDMVGVVYSYQRLSDPDTNVPGIFLTVFHPSLPADTDSKGYAKYGLLGYAHGEYPFVVHRNEYLSRRFHDSRGLPEPGKPFQDQIKVHRDSRIDAASISIIPPLMYPIGRPPPRWGPGARIPERKPNEYHYGDRPTPDGNTDDSENRLMESGREYFGIRTTEGDPLMVNVKNQRQVKKALACWAKSFKQVFKLFQQFGDEQTFYRVLGVQNAQPKIFLKGDPTEDYDIYLNFDVLSQDLEHQKEKFVTIGQIVQTFDRNGQVDYSALLTVALNSVDPSLAEQIVQPKDTATKKNVDEMHAILSDTFSGIVKDIPPQMPPQLALQTMQTYTQSPDVAQRLRNPDDPFTQRMDRLFKQASLAQDQQNNAQIGKLGTMPAPPPNA